MTLPFICGLTPTYGRPKLLANAIACWQCQDYPIDRRMLYILDDAGQIEPQGGPGWRLFSTDKRYPSLPAKFNELVMIAMKNSRPIIPDAFAVWEDDDVYLPWSLSSNATVLDANGWNHPEHVWSTYTNKPELERANGRFHASLVISFKLLFRVALWPMTKRGDFDQRLMGRLRKECGPGRPLPPSYVFRWGQTHDQHGQGFMRGPDDEQWYDRYARGLKKFEPVGKLEPRFDDPTYETFEQLAGIISEPEFAERLVLFAR